MSASDGVSLDHIPSIVDGTLQSQGSARFVKACVACAKPQEPGQKPLQRCSGCKQVMYCGMCRMTTRMRQAAMQTEPDDGRAVKEFEKWSVCLLSFVEGLF
ncbi:hypothetical protein CONPUDRAFT_49350 [Coniophora puteana RWD-64-598 SS2]|uniref:Uncharacterized protein n=1 Tax=Coniophora puteana (strain RWD-64-598) TaxID=741705 RepID=A0A5M3N2V8_CONPW|nr:uncharacterized protein CONPUDRAFT_49350 [Coniophora puteana RWD-64-598 SS2]EIW85722.1 hypothetical protein CONPUDRAFT_49350 [Coniophora puteana RWD-64-598 SS2]